MKYHTIFLSLLTAIFLFPTASYAQEEQPVNVDIVPQSNEGILTAPEEEMIEAQEDAVEVKEEKIQEVVDVKVEIQKDAVEVQEEAQVEVVEPPPVVQPVKAVVKVDVAPEIIEEKEAPSLTGELEESPSKDLIDSSVIQSIKAFVDTDIVRLSIENQNKKYNGMKEDDIIKLDQKWRAETKSDIQPIISSTLSNPLSSYLTRVQARSFGLYTEMFAMDSNGLNVGQSNISSDYWQGDEAKFQKTYPLGPKAIFIDEPEYDENLAIWRTQANLSVADKKGQVIGAITVEVNLTELQRRKALGLK